MNDDFLSAYAAHERDFPQPRAPAIVRAAESRPVRSQTAPVTVPQMPSAVPDAAALPPFRLLTAAQIADWPPITWAVHGVIPQEGVGVIAGQPGSGKSFLALDLAGSLASGREWFGHRVMPSKSFYIALEGSGGIAQRVRAYQSRHGDLKGVRFIVDSTFRLFFEDDVAALAEAIRNADGTGGLVIVDTLARAAVGLDENSSADMGRLVAGLAALAEGINGCVIAVHHLGKDSQRGLRGHSSLLGAVDFVIEVTRSDAAREWKIGKAKDGVDGDSHPFRLDVVDLGEDEHGDPITSCVISPEENAGNTIKRVRVPQGGNQLVVWNALGEILRNAGTFGKAGAPPTRPCVEIEAAVVACREKLATDPKRRTERTRQAITGLVASGLIQINEGWLWVA